MKTIVIACGAGLATSSMVRDKIQALLKSNGISNKIIQCTLNEVENYDADADLIITTMKVRKKYKAPVISGSSYLTGINEDLVTEQILEVLKS